MNKSNRIKDSERDLAAEILEAAKEIKAGGGKMVRTSEVVAARVNLNLSKTQFSALLGVSVETLQEWEQGKSEPSVAAQEKVTHALKNPRTDL